MAKDNKSAPQKPAADKTQAPQGTMLQPGIQIAAQYIKDLSFENPNSPESLIGGWGQPETTVNISLRNETLKDNAYECVLQLRVEARKKGEDRIAFIAELTYAAIAVLQNVPKENHAAVMMVEIPKLMFPFAREIIASATSQGGYPPLYLTPVSFESLYMNEMKRLQEQQGKKAG